MEKRNVLEQDRFLVKGYRLKTVIEIKSACRIRYKQLFEILMKLTLILFYAGEEDEVQKNGKVFAKLALGEYEWMSYNMVHASVVSFGAGLRFHLKQQPGSLITMYAETRAEWMISCLGAFSQVRSHLFNINFVKSKKLFNNV